MYFPDRVASSARCSARSRQGTPCRRLLGADRSRPRLPAPGGYRRPAMRTWAADVLAAPFVLGDQAEARQARCRQRHLGAKITLHEGSIRFPSVQEFIRIEVKGSPWPACSATMRCELSPRNLKMRWRSSSCLRARLSCRWTRTYSPQARARSRVGKARSPRMRWSLRRRSGIRTALGCFAVRGPSGDAPVTCDSHLPTVTARVHRGPAVSDAVRTQRGPGCSCYRELGKLPRAARRGAGNAAQGAR